MFEAPQASDLAERLSDNERDRREAESERLVALAKENGLYIPETDYGKFGIRNTDRTGESVVYKNDAENRHYKVKDPYAKAPIKGNAPEDAIYEHLVHNRLFPEDKYRFEGIGNNYLEDVRIICRNLPCCRQDSRQRRRSMPHWLPGDCTRRTSTLTGTSGFPLRISKVTMSW